MDNKNSFDSDIPLGKEAEYHFEYDPGLLFPIPRKKGREDLGMLADEVPFDGVDRWTAFELSWLNEKGMPQVGIAEFDFSCNSKNIIESKSFKLYLNSFNQTPIKDKSGLISTLQQDLSLVCDGAVTVKIFGVDNYPIIGPDNFTCMDDSDITCNNYEPKADLLSLTGNQKTTQTQFKSHLLRSLCPVTGQPDWATVYIDYTGHEISTSSLLTYIISYRNHQGFHEQCVEQIFTDIQQQCKPHELTVYARFMRRGGLDINPMRYCNNSNKKLRELINIRTARQ